MSSFTDLDNNMKRYFRELARQALNAELRGPLLELAGDFDRWKSGEMSGLDLDLRIFAFESGERKRLDELYRQTTPDVLVARAVFRGLLTRDQIRPDVVEMLAGPLSLWKDGLVNF